MTVTQEQQAEIDARVAALTALLNPFHALYIMFFFYAGTYGLLWMSIKWNLIVWMCRRFEGAETA